MKKGINYKSRYSTVGRKKEKEQPTETVEMRLNRLALEDSEFTSSEMVLITLSILESKGWHGLLQLMTIINDPEIIYKLIRFFYGMTLSFPDMKDFVDAMRTSQYVFMNFHKKFNKSTEMRKVLNITAEEETKYSKIAEEWLDYLYKHNMDITQIMHINNCPLQKVLRRVQKNNNKVVRKPRKLPSALAMKQRLSAFNNSKINGSK